MEVEELGKVKKIRETKVKRVSCLVKFIQNAIRVGSFGFFFYCIVAGCMLSRGETTFTLHYLLLFVVILYSLYHPCDINCV